MLIIDTKGAKLIVCIGNQGNNQNHTIGCCSAIADWIANRQCFVKQGFVHGIWTRAFFNVSRTLDFQDVRQHGPKCA